VNKNIRPDSAPFRRYELAGFSPRSVPDPLALSPSFSSHSIAGDTGCYKREGWLGSLITGVKVCWHRQRGWSEVAASRGGEQREGGGQASQGKKERALRRGETSSVYTCQVGLVFLRSEKTRAPCDRKRTNGAFFSPPCGNIFISFHPRCPVTGASPRAPSFVASLRLGVWSRVLMVCFKSKKVVLFLILVLKTKIENGKDRGPTE